MEKITKLPVLRLIERQLSKKLYSYGSLKTAGRIFLEVVVLGLLYFCYCLYFFHGIWYLNALIFISTLTFMYCFYDMRMDGLEAKFKKDIPRTVRKLKYYLIFTNDVSKALESACQKAPDTTQGYMKKLKQAADSGNFKEELEELKERTSYEWLKMLCDLVYYCKVNGDREQAVTRNLARMTKIIEFVNIQQGLDNVQLQFAQNFVILLPLLGIPGIQLFYHFLLTVLEQPELYLMQSAEIMAAQILLLSNAANIFISWIRKNH